MTSSLIPHTRLKRPKHLSYHFCKYLMLIHCNF
nr:MAG TPA: hypothetical protein [Caudoviricetes sp.]